MMTKRIWFWVAGLILLAGCKAPRKDQQQTPGSIKIDLTDPAVQNLYDLQDRQQTDSLAALFSSSNPTLRYLAAMAFASVKDKAAVDKLAALLNDPSLEVRQAAAYALGQTGDSKAEEALVAAFQQRDSLDVARLNATILEAIGKCGTEKHLRSLATISTYTFADTALLEGQAYGIYRYGLRDMVLPEATARMVEYGTNAAYPASVRIIAASYLGRIKKISPDSMAGEAMVKAVNSETNPYIRMGLVLGLGKTRTESALQCLTDLSGREQDYRVLCNLVRALANFPYLKAAPTAYNLLRHPNLHVANSAARYFVDNGVASEAGYYWKFAKDTLQWPTQLLLYAAAHKFMPNSYPNSKEMMNKELMARFSHSNNAYEKAAVIKAMAAYPWNYRNIRDMAFNDPSPVVKGACVEGWYDICKLPYFYSYFGSGSARRVRAELFEYLVEAMNSGDAAMVALAAQALREPLLEYKKMAENTDFLTNALQKIKLPRETETYNELQKTIDYFKGQPETPAKKPEFNNPINWIMVASVTEYTKALLQTRYGNITLQFFPERAPGTVANFMQLASNGFFNGKVFHRVVPNFVIQGGCPRGDGYGALDYSIRSELAQLHYDNAGYVGMASAGNHTEGTQFFITHSPTPHLDGNYTIFARVTDGMDVVHKVQVGDVIEKVTIIK